MLEKIKNWVRPSVATVAQDLGIARAHLEQVREEYAADLLNSGTANAGPLEAAKREVERLQLLQEAAERAQESELIVQKTAERHAVYLQRKLDRERLTLAGQALDDLLPTLESVGVELAEAMLAVVTHDESIRTQVRGAGLRVPGIVSSRLRGFNAKQDSPSIDASNLSKYLPRAEDVKE